MTDKKAPFEFIFSDRAEYILKKEDIAQIYDLGFDGIRLENKYNVEKERFVDYILEDGYAPYFLCKRNGKGGVRVLYIWSDYKDDGKDKRHHSEWVLTLLQLVDPKYELLKTDKRGERLRTTRQVKDIAPAVDYYITQLSKEHKNGTKDDVYIRIKMTTSRWQVYCVYKEHWSEVSKYLKTFRYEYKIVDTSKYK